MRKRYLRDLEMLDSKPVVTPMEGQLTLSDVKGEPVDSTLYMQVIGCFM